MATTRWSSMGGTPSASRSLMIWSWVVVFSICRGPRTAATGVMSVSKIWRTRFTKCRRVVSAGGAGLSSH